MATVYVGIGSNIDKHFHIPKALDELREKFGHLTISPIYQTPAIGFEGENFYNLVVGICTELSPRAVNSFLRQLESKHGRKRSGENQFVSRTLDLDQLLYGDMQIDDGVISIPHDDITNYAFVLKPLADIAGEMQHPSLKTTINNLWRNFDKQRLNFQKVRLEENSQAEILTSF